MKLSDFAAVAALGVAVSGCASIVEGTTQNVAITTPPTDGAKCTLTSSQGTWYLTSPGNATVHKTKDNLNVTCKKDGFQDGVVSIPPEFNGATMGNVLAGGIVGIGIDAATGANYNYPQSTAVPMVPIVPPSTATPPSSPSASVPTSPPSKPSS